MCQECQEIEVGYSESSFGVSEGWDKTVEYKSAGVLENNKLTESVSGKVCKRCGEWKLFLSFSPDKREKDGYRTWCKVCKNAYEKFRKSPDFVPARSLISISEVLKYCTKCFGTKSISYFYVDNRSKDGLDYMCKDCRSSYEKWRKSPSFVYVFPERPDVPEGMKYCSSCEEIKSFVFFQKSKQTKDGYVTFCKECTKTRYKGWEAEREKKFSTEKAVVETKVCSICLKEKSLGFFHKSFGGKYGVESMCKACRLKKERFRRDTKNYLSDPNSSKICSRCGILKRASEFHNNKNNKDGLHSNCKECSRAAYIERLRINPEARIRARLRSRLHDFIKRGANISADAAIDFLGCTVPEFLAYLEQQFYTDSRSGREMTWENYGRPGGVIGWELEHIFPLSRKRLEDPEQLKSVCHYTNICPLWAWENRKKSNKLPSELEAEGQEV
jgi:hypothetical protein